MDALLDSLFPPVGMFFCIGLIVVGVVFLRNTLNDYRNPAEVLARLGFVHTPDAIRSFRTGLLGIMIGAAVAILVGACGLIALW